MSLDQAVTAKVDSPDPECHVARCVSDEGILSKKAKVDGSTPETTMSSAPNVKSQGVKQQSDDAGEPTLWEIVSRNRRKAKRDRSKKSDTLRQDDLTSHDDQLDSLFSMFHSSAAVETKKTQPSSDDPASDLFESADHLLGNAPGSVPLTLNADGELQMDQSFHAQIDPHDLLMQSSEGRDLVREDFAENKGVTPFANAYKYTKAAQWSTDDEHMYYSALETFGLDFTMIQTFLPRFTLKQIRDKYRCDERRRPGKIDSHLNQRRPVLTVNDYELLYGKIDPSKHFQCPSSRPPASPSVIETPSEAAKVSSIAGLLDGTAEDLFSDLLAMHEA